MGVWACLAAHQAAEKAVKALYQKLGLEVWGHSISRLLENLPEGYKHYITIRYPNTYPEGAPMDYYTKSEAERAVGYACRIIEFCRSKGL